MSKNMTAIDAVADSMAIMCKGIGLAAQTDQHQEEFRRCAAEALRKAIEAVDGDEIFVPSDIQEFSDRHRIPNFGDATYRNGFIDGRRHARRKAEAMSEAHHIAQADRLDAWASTQIRAALAVLLAERESDWFEDHSEAFRVRLKSMSVQHLAEALHHRERAHRHLRYGNIGFFKDSMREALHDIRMAKHYGRRVA